MHFARASCSHSLMWDGAYLLTHGCSVDLEVVFVVKAEAVVEDVLVTV